jgi:hypothetical protein
LIYLKRADREVSPFFMFQIKWYEPQGPEYSGNPFPPQAAENLPAGRQVNSSDLNPRPLLLKGEGVKGMRSLKIGVKKITKHVG